MAACNWNSRNRTSISLVLDRSLDTNDTRYKWYAVPYISFSTHLKMLSKYGWSQIRWISWMCSNCRMNNSYFRKRVFALPWRNRQYIFSKIFSFIISAICYSGKSSARWMCSRRVGRLLGPAGIAVVASQCNDSILPTTAQQGSPPNEPVRGFSQLVLTVQLVHQSTGPHSELASQVNWASKDSFGLDANTRMSDPKLEVQGRESRPKDDKWNQK